MWLADATADLELLELATGLKIQDATPGERLELAKNAIQYPIDVTLRASRKRFRSLLRGVLASRLDCRRVGVITHSTLTSAAKSLGRMFDERIAKVAYFRSGQDRGSNDWHDIGCDLIVIAGTPRLPEIAIRLMLHRVGHYGAIDRGGDWGDLRWQGFTPDGKPRIITGRGYREPLWRQVHRSKVRAAIIQAAGRARALLETGADVVVLSTEECGFPIADVGKEPVPVTDSEAAVLTALKDIASYIVIKEQCPLIASTGEIANRCGVTERQARRSLSGLEQRGLVERIGERSGWRLAASWQATADAGLDTTDGK